LVGKENNVPQSADGDGHKLALISLAKEIATAGTGSSRVEYANRRRFLELFRAAYLHLAASVEHGGGILSLNPAKVSLTDTDKYLAAFDEPK
jgi:hypothetical protein